MPLCEVKNYLKRVILLGSWNTTRMQVGDPCRDRSPAVKLRAAGITYRQRSLSTMLMGCVSPSSVEEEEESLPERPRSVCYINDDISQGSSASILRGKIGKVKRERRSSLTKSFLLLSFKRNVKVETEADEGENRAFPFKGKCSVDEERDDDEPNPGALYRSMLQPLYCPASHIFSPSFVHCELCTAGMNESKGNVGLENITGRVGVGDSQFTRNDIEKNKTCVVRCEEQSNNLKCSGEKLTRIEDNEELETNEKQIRVTNLNKTEPHVIHKPILRQRKQRSKDRPKSCSDVDRKGGRPNSRFSPQSFTHTLRSRPISWGPNPGFSPRSQGVMSSLLYHLTSLSPSSSSHSDIGNAVLQCN